MITLFCSCLAARLDIYTVKTLVNEELVCHWSCVGNKADHSISLSLSPSLTLSVFPVVVSVFLPVYPYCSIAPPPIIHPCVAFSDCIMCVRNKWNFDVANASYRFFLACCLSHTNTHTHMHTHADTHRYPQCIAVARDVHLTISNELACVPSCRCFVFFK